MNDLENIKRILCSLDRAGCLVFAALLGACADDDTTSHVPGGPETASMDGGARPSQPSTDAGTSAATADASRPDLVRVETARALGDCSRADEACLEAHGVYQGKPFACDGTPGVVYRDGDGEGTRLVVMLLHCGADLGGGITAMIPAGRVGSFDHSVARSVGDRSAAWIELRDALTLGESVSSAAQNFAGHMTGVVAPEPWIRGSLRATWPLPGGHCKAKTADALCGETSVVLTFSAPTLW